ncbi:MAG: GntR family transcriptional regulator [Alphaproteobacteria bacterium]|nr:GntR family transcriptional regulator [Alphaproteobacteria bacterium]
MSDATNRAYEFLRASILDGSLPAGSRLLETAIAEQAGVSRTPVREAIRRLDSEGLVHLRPHFGAIVRSWTLSELEDMFSLRAVIEAHAAGRAATRITPQQLRELSVLAEDMLALAEVGAPDSRDRISERNAEFHRTLIDAARSERVRSMMSQVVDMPLSLRTILRYDAQALARSVRHHLEIVAALQSRDPTWAESVMRSHVIAAWHAIEADAKAHLAEASAQA